MADSFVLKELCRYSLGTFAEIIYRNALFHPDDEAFVSGCERVSFSGFNRRVNSLVNALRDAGYKKGDVLGVLSWNCLEYMEIWGAAMKGGFIIAHLSPRLTHQDLISLIKHARIKILFCGPDFAEHAALFRKEIDSLEMWFGFGRTDRDNSYREFSSGGREDEFDIELGREDPLTIFFTSGTTGTPRGAVYSHRQKMENCETKALGLGAQFGDRNLVVLPMFHIGGDSHIWPFFLTGGCNVIMEENVFDTKSTADKIGAEKITDIHIVPTQLVAILNDPELESYDLSTLKRIWYAASPMPTEVLKRGIKRLGPIFMQGYGMTESGPNTTMLSKEEHCDAIESSAREGILASCGRPCIGVQMRVVDLEGRDLPSGEIGEIIVKAERLMSGYWNLPDDTCKVMKDGWLYTGDLGYYDNEGYIYIADRKKDMIITGGENVYPKEVEDVLYQHPAVYEAAVIGVPDPYWVERVHAVVVLNSGVSASREGIKEEIIDFCKNRMARFKAPKTLQFLPELPKSPQGKVLKRELRKMV